MIEKIIKLKIPLTFQTIVRYCPVKSDVTFYIQNTHGRCETECSVSINKLVKSALDDVYEDGIEGYADIEDFQLDEIKSLIDQLSKFVEEVEKLK